MVLPFENNADREIHTGYYSPKIEIKDLMLWLMDSDYILGKAFEKTNKYRNYK